MSFSDLILNQDFLFTSFSFTFSWRLNHSISCLNIGHKERSVSMDGLVLGGGFLPLRHDHRGFIALKSSVIIMIKNLPCFVVLQ